jgi:hypothetical protein
MKKTIAIIFLLAPMFTLAQYSKSSKFLYGKSRSKLPYYVGINIGAVSNNYVGNKDFVNYGSAFAWGMYFEKPLGYRPSLSINFRTMGNYSSSVLDKELGTLAVESSELKSSYDLSINFNYLLFDWYGWLYKSSVGLGFVHNGFQLNNYTPIITESTTAVIPLQLSTGRQVYKRFELELGYRYYLGLDNKIEGIAFNNKFDKYSYAFVGLKYLIGEKDYRFQKKGSCPSVE